MGKLIREPTPLESGGYEGDVYYGNPNDSTEETHHWIGGKWVIAENVIEVGSNTLQTTPLYHAPMNDTELINILDATGHGVAARRLMALREQLQNMKDVFTSYATMHSAKLSTIISDHAKLQVHDKIERNINYAAEIQAKLDETY